MAKGKLSLDNLDKANWKKYRFDQIAFSISERVEPQQTDLDVYYGLEHIDADSLHIRRSGTPSDVEGTKLRAYPGDIIFGKRRAYQRKASICEVDAICSAHAMVLRANPAVIHPSLFPFFMHSDSFMNRAIDISVGSLSPTINWGTLKVQEFLLPPKDQQEKLAELLWAGDEVVQKYEELLSALQLIQKKLQSTLRQASTKKPNISLRQIISLEYGEPLKEEDRTGDDYEVFVSANVVGKHNTFNVKGPGIIVGRKGGAGIVNWSDNDFYAIDTAFWVDFKNDNKYNRKFIFHLLQSINLPSLVITTVSIR